MATNKDTEQSTSTDEETKKVNSSYDAEDDDDIDDNFNYYSEEDIDALVDQETTVGVLEHVEEDRLATNIFNHSGSAVAVKRLIQDMKSMTSESIRFGISASPIENNLFAWNVQFLDIPEDSKLGCDLAHYSKAYKTEPVIHLNMQFPQDYPFSPPFIRVVRPRFQFMTGHVTLGGSICMQLLTKSGWLPTNDIESILVQVRAQLLSDPNATLDTHRPNTDYSESEAKIAFERMVHKYGW